MDLKKNATLIIGIAIPVIMIILVAVSIYIPPLFMHPKYNFLYVSGDEYNSEYTYHISGGTLVKEKKERNKNDDYGYNRSSYREQKLFLHDTQKNESREISYEEARGLKLDTDEKSPDGFEVISSWSGGGFLFFDGGSHRGQYLKRNSYSKKLNTQASGDYYYDFNFLGWIIK